MDRTLAVLVAALALTGCDLIRYIKIAVTEAEQQRDEDECMRIYRAGMDSGVANCMAKRGYGMDIDYRRTK